MHENWMHKSFPEHRNSYELVFHVPMHLTNRGTDIRINFDGLREENNPPSLHSCRYVCIFICISTRFHLITNIILTAHIWNSNSISG